jgi:hypothetical protein
MLFHIDVERSRGATADDEEEEEREAEESQKIIDSPR